MLNCLLTFESLKTNFDQVVDYEPCKYLSMPNRRCSKQLSFEQEALVWRKTLQSAERFSKGSTTSEFEELSSPDEETMRISVCACFADSIKPNSSRCISLRNRVTRNPYLTANFVFQGHNWNGNLQKIYSFQGIEYSAPKYVRPKLDDIDGKNALRDSILLLVLGYFGPVVRKIRL